ncbi:MAG TPA: hypothetical protein VGM87_23925 [Roseomonas sp.]|jgi:hypothetical protein
MQEVVGFVAQALATQDDVEPIAGGYLRTTEEGLTMLAFLPIPQGGHSGLVTGVALVETRFASDIWADCDDDFIAWLNQRAAAGSFFRDARGVGCRLTYSLYHDDPLARWIAMDLLGAFGRQLAIGQGLFAMEVSRAHFHASRQVIGVSRHWAKRLPLDAFEEIADGLRQYWGIVSSAESHRLVFEVPMTADTATRGVDPDAETALITIRTDIQHPLAGVGYCATIVLPRQPPPELLTMWCTRLNALEHQQQDFAPRLGAWGKRDLGTRLVYGLFCPADAAGLNRATNIAHWMVMRALWVRTNFWTPDVGLHYRGEDA